MPLTEKGSKIMRAMQKQYGAEKGKSVFYASKNKGKIKGVDGVMQSVDLSAANRRVFKRRVSDAIRRGMTADQAIRYGVDAATRPPVANFRDRLATAYDSGMTARDAIQAALGRKAR